MGFALGVARPLVFGWWVLILLLPRGLGVVGINLAYIIGGAFEWVCLKLLLDRMARSPNESGRGQLRGGRVSFELVDTIFFASDGYHLFF